MGWCSLRGRRDPEGILKGSIFIPRAGTAQEAAGPVSPTLLSHHHTSLLPGSQGPLVGRGCLWKRI